MKPKTLGLTVKSAASASSVAFRTFQCWWRMLPIKEASTGFACFQYASTGSGTAPVLLEEAHSATASALPAFLQSGFGSCSTRHRPSSSSWL